MSAPTDFEIHQEADEVPSRLILRVVVVSIATAVVGVFFAALLVVAGHAPLGASRATRAAASAAGREISRVEQTPILNAQDGLDLRAKQRAELERYGWADRDAGIATIPIDEAIDLIVKEQR